MSRVISNFESERRGDSNIGSNPYLRLTTSILALALDAGFAELSEAVEGGG